VSCWISVVLGSGRSSSFSLSDPFVASSALMDDAVSDNLSSWISLVWSTRSLIIIDGVISDFLGILT
jgi:hypothetical protein